MNFEKITLNLPAETEQDLKASFKKAVELLEEKARLSPKIFEELKEKLTQAIANNEPLNKVLSQINSSGDFYHANLFHPDTEILNLPWEIAIDPVSQQPLNEIDRLFISKNCLDTPRKEQNLKGGPLKVLVMISSPKDVHVKGRLNYEEEERQILKSFKQLYRSGEVQIDFTDNGSLAALKRKIGQNDYHILHFTGHGDFDEAKGEGRLLLENDLSLNSESIGANAFAEAVLKPSHTIPLVVLCSCKTAQANLEKGMAGVTSALLQKGIPSAVSMGLSILDNYATSFAANFYESISKKETIQESFKKACNLVKVEETENLLKANLGGVPMQWVIPNLYLSEKVKIVDWDKKFEKLTPEIAGGLFVNSKLEQPNVEDFVGRREDLAVILPAFFDNQPILLKGQGGIGKTTFARKLAQRLRANNPDTVCFVFNEEGQEFSVDKVLEQLKSLCVDKGKNEWIKELEHLGDSVVLKIQSLLKKLGDHFSLFILFDNIESFQNLETKEFSINHEAALAIMDTSARHTRIHTVVTGRYPIKEIEGLFKEFDLKDIDFNDFTRKCYNLKLWNLNEERMDFLYKSVGGNFRFVEFFVKAFVDDGINLRTDFADFESFVKEIEKAKDQALPEMDSFKNFIFEKIWQKLDSDEQEIAQILYHFTLPVIDIAFELQGFDKSIKAKLQRLKELTLIQVYWDRETDLIYYFMPPLVKNLLERQTDIEDMPNDFHEKAGRYHYYMFQSIHVEIISEHEAVFRHFCRSGNKDRVDEIGKGLSSFYYDRALFRNSLEIAQSVLGVLSDDAPLWCRYWIGLNFLSFGQYEQALPFFEYVLEALKKLELSDIEKQNKGVTLSNIGVLYQAQGDTATALEYLKQSLKISREIDDKSGESSTLHNISEIYKCQGDTSTALEYLKQSLKIRREIGDKVGLISTLHNIAQIEISNKNLNNAISFEMEAYQLAQETNDAMGLFYVGQIWGWVLVVDGMKAENMKIKAAGMSILQRAYDIGQKAGYPGTERVKQMLDKFGEGS
jgi:tetratricopeptide (TPR) repeat protein